MKCANEQERWSYIIKLDEEFLKGGVILSEKCSFIVRESDIAFARGAFLAAIITVVAGVETYLRAEKGSIKKERLFDLIEQADVEDDLKRDMHRLRKYRNKWVHVDEPWDDEALLEHPEEYQSELEDMALLAVKSLRRTVYLCQWI